MEAQDAGRKMSVLDGYKLQSSLEQLYSAVEALARGRKRDVQLVNSYLSASPLQIGAPKCSGEVYQRIEKDLPSDKGESDLQEGPQVFRLGLLMTFVRS